MTESEPKPLLNRTLICLKYPDHGQGTMMTGKSFEETRMEFLGGSAKQVIPLP